MQLRAGKLLLTYEDGFLRWIVAGEDEVLRMIYFAVRDKDWNTIPAQLLNEKIEQQENYFTISYEMLFDQDEIKMHWQVVIEGGADNSIVYDIQGKALTAFRKNRSGICVLHPIKECSGKKVIITHTDKTVEENIFPVYISPHQPFKNIAAMQWEAGDNCNVFLEFEGDDFETEDHRNWTDNSFKTYCTPLEIPYPVVMQKGDEVQQKITLRVEGSFVPKENDDVIKIVIEKEVLPIPKIGIGWASEPNEYHGETLKLLSGIKFDHYRIDISLERNDWEQILQQCFAEAKLFNSSLEIALFVYKDCNERLIRFINIIRSSQGVQQIILLEENAKCISNQLLQEMLLLLKPALPGILIGAGTDAYFTELNRSNLDVSAIDFVSYPMNPQVHASDDATLFENAAAQGATVVAAKKKFDRMVHVSPVTLKMRYNADATDKSKALNRPPSDPRQQTKFCAAWLVSSLKSLMENGVAAVTYFETVGERGIADDNMQLFPAAHIFRAVLNKEFTHIYKSYSSRPFDVSSLVLSGNMVYEVLLANQTNEIKKIEIKTTDEYKAFEAITNEIISIERKDRYKISFTVEAYQAIILKQIKDM